MARHRPWGWGGVCEDLTDVDVLLRFREKSWLAGLLTTALDIILRENNLGIIYPCNHNLGLHLHTPPPPLCACLLVFPLRGQSRTSFQLEGSGLSLTPLELTPAVVISTPLAWCCSFCAFLGVEQASLWRKAWELRAKYTGELERKGRGQALEAPWAALWKKLSKIRTLRNWRFENFRMETWRLGLQMPEGMVLLSLPVRGILWSVC